jgi:hypothetical protein
VSWSKNRWAERTGIAVTGKSEHFGYWKERTAQGGKLAVEGRLIEMFLVVLKHRAENFSVFCRENKKSAGAFWKTKCGTKHSHSLKCPALVYWPCLLPRPLRILCWDSL